MLAVLLQSVDTSPTPVAGVHVAWSAVAPTLVLIGGALLLLAVSSLTARPVGKGIYALWTVVTAGVAIGAAVPLWDRVLDGNRGPFSTLAQAVGVDGFSVFSTVVVENPGRLCIAVAVFPRGVEVRPSRI